jgi:predicted transcriptional regulator
MAQQLQIAQTVKDLLAIEQRNLDAIRVGLADLAAGRVAPHKEMIPVIQSLRSRKKEWQP